MRLTPIAIALTLFGSALLAACGESSKDAAPSPGEPSPDEPSPSGSGASESQASESQASGDWAAIGVVGASEATGLQFLDIRGAAAFEKEHIVGALHLDASELRTTLNGIAGQAPPREEANAVLSAAGIDADRPIVVYGEGNDTSAGRALWSLAYYGSQAGLRLLDGGLSAWKSAGQPVQGGPAMNANETLAWAGGDTRAELRVDQAWMLDQLGAEDITVFDVRSPGEYEAGHVPGAINVPWTDNLAEGGLLRNATEILELHGNPGSNTLVVYCQSGARASVSWAALSFATRSNVRLYDGSWNEWGADPQTPKTTGSSPL